MCSADHCFVFRKISTFILYLCYLPLLPGNLVTTFRFNIPAECNTQMKLGGWRCTRVCDWWSPSIQEEGHLLQLWVCSLPFLVLEGEWGHESYLGHYFPDSSCLYATDENTELKGKNSDKGRSSIHCSMLAVWVTPGHPSHILSP